MKSSLKIILLVVFGTLYLQTMVAFGADRNIHIDANVGEEGDGSIASPYNDFSDIKWKPGGDRSVADWVAAGDDVKIRLKRGSIWNERLNVLRSGSEEHPIVIEPYGIGDIPVISGNGSTVAISIREQHHININRIALINCGLKALNIAASNNIQVRNCRFSNSQSGGIQIIGQNRIDTHSIIIDGCSFTGLAINGILIQIGGWGSELGGGDGTVYNVRIENNIFNMLKIAICIVGTEAITTSHGGIAPYEITIADNTISNTDKAAIVIRGLRDIGRGSFISRNTLTNIGMSDLPNINALQLNWVTGLTVEDNLIDTVRTSQTDGCGIILDYAWSNNNYISDNVVVRRNTLKNCNALGKGKGISAWKAKNSLIYSNLIINCSKGIKIANSESAGTMCYNNTIIGCDDGIFIENSGDGTALYNNIVFQSNGNGIRVIESDAPESDYNCVYGSTIENFRGVAIKGNNSIELNPAFKNAGNSNYQLSFDSPCVDSGINASFITSDLLGNPLPINGIIDIGAYEFNDQGTGQFPSMVQNLRLKD